MAITELINSYPHASIIIFAALISLFISIVNYFMLDKDRMKEIKDRQKTVQGQIKQHQKDGNTQKAMELQKELLADMPEMFKHSMKPMLITFIPIIFLFSFLRSSYAETAIASTWFWWYLGTAIASSMIFRKLFKLP